ncbi:uncharacterized protein [Physcomitrium patens]|uniref:uncharacterized protein n=1 Tax=Physcomitrium patens TaxID=3218 RepID=UPI000D17872B|nr:uncharacterized protein LOC112287389 [Physcomitrium patens]|eukprot:XP_024386094.1 uncharacterized protein LOC112287389 [Physcomitrella patens]
MKQGNLRGQQSPKRRQTQTRALARAYVEKAKLRKTNLTDLPVHGIVSEGSQNPLCKESIITKSPRAQPLQSSDYIEERSCFDRDGGAIYGSDEGRSLSLLQRGAYCRDRHNNVSEEEEEDTDVSLQNLSHTATGKTIIADEIQNYPGSNDVDLNGFFAEDIPTLTDHLNQEKQNRLENHLQNAPTRKRGRPRKYPIGEAQQPRTPLNVNSHAQRDKVQPLAKRKRGRPFKHQILPQDFTSLNGPSRQMRDIFISRRQPVTQAEKDDALTAAHSFASGIEATNIVIVMRQSFVYRNFVMGMPKKFGQCYMPAGNKETRICDTEWKVWFCSWNAACGYLSGRGWRNFALDHCLEEDDTVVFEVIAESKTMVTLMAHIFRVVAIPDGVTGWQSHICPPDCFVETHSGLLIQPIPRMKLTTQQERDLKLEGSAMTDSLRS